MNREGFTRNILCQQKNWLTEQNQGEIEMLCFVRCSYITDIWVRSLLNSSAW